jgi:hypothetical protein
VADYLGPIQALGVPLPSGQYLGPAQFISAPLIGEQFLGPIQAFPCPLLTEQFLGPAQFTTVAIVSPQHLSPIQFFFLEVRVAGIKGKQIATGADGIATANLVDGVLSANAAGRAKIATGFFDLATVNDKFAAASIALDRLAEAVIQADGGQAFTADQSMGGFKLTNLGTPTGALDATNKQYVDGVASGIDWKQSVRLATAAALPANTPAGSGVGKTLTANANGALSVDGVAVAVADRVLVKNEAAGANNGIYTVTATGSAGAPYVLTRATDFDQDAEVTAGAATFATEGSTQADTGWVLITNDPIVVDTTALSFTQFTGTGALTFGMPVAVGTANAEGVATTVSRSDHVHDAPAPSTLRKSVAPTVTSGNFSSTGITAGFTPALGGHVRVVVNGVEYPVGDGNRLDLGGFTNNVVAYFSADGGATAKAMSAIVSTDTLYWNGTNAGFNLAVTDEVSIHGEAF